MKFGLKLLWLFYLLCACGTSFGGDNSLKSAIEASEHWLAILDQGQYDVAWDQAADVFKQKVSKEDWQRALEMARGRAGMMESRRVLSSESVAQLPDSPAGKYFVLQFQTKFAKIPPVIETVAPILDKDGQWRVSGYTMKLE